MKIFKEDLKNYVGKKITNPGWRKKEWLLILFIGEVHVFGIDEQGREQMWTKDFGNWETYEEPKQQVKMWQALMRDMYTGKYFISVHYFEHEDAVKKYEIDGRFIKLLPHTEIEVEV